VDAETKHREQMLSKQFRKQLRANMRQKRNKRLNNILERIDFIASSRLLCLFGSRATEQLVLQSGHRVVRAISTIIPHWK